MRSSASVNIRAPSSRRSFMAPSSLSSMRPIFPISPWSWRNFSCKGVSFMRLSFPRYKAVSRPVNAIWPYMAPHLPKRVNSGPIWAVVCSKFAPNMNQKLGLLQFAPILSPRNRLI